MKILIALLALLATTAAAADPITFGAAGACPTYCYLFPPTSDANTTIDFIGAGMLNISINGKVYVNRQAQSYMQVLSVISATYPLSSVRQVANVPYTAEDGSIITATIVYNQTTVVINSGRAHGYLTRQAVTGGVIQ